MTTTTVDSKKSNNFFDMSHLFCLSTYNRGVSLNNLDMRIQKKKQDDTFKSGWEAGYYKL